MGCCTPRRFRHFLLSSLLRRRTSLVQGGCSVSLGRILCRFDRWPGSRPLLRQYRAAADRQRPQSSPSTSRTAFPSPRAQRLESFFEWRLAVCCFWGELRPVPLEARGAFPRALLQAWPVPTTPSRLGTRAPMSPQGCRREPTLGSCKAWGVCGLPKRRLGWRVPPPQCAEVALGRSGVAWQSPPRPERIPHNG